MTNEQRKGRRDYKKESEWAKKRYEEIHIRIDKETGKKFKRKIKENKDSINGYMKKVIIKYIEKE